MEEMKTAAAEKKVNTEAPKTAAKTDNDKKKVKKPETEIAELTKKLAAKTAECEGLRCAPEQDVSQMFPSLSVRNPRP